MKEDPKSVGQINDDGIVVYIGLNTNPASSPQFFSLVDPQTRI